jgi:hypothetical protein
MGWTAEAAEAAERQQIAMVMARFPIMAAGSIG